MIRKTEIYQVFFFIQQYIKSECNDNDMHDLLHKNSILEISVLLGGILQFRIITSPYVFTPPPLKNTNKSKDSIIYYSSNIYDLYPKMSGKITFFTYQAYPFTMQFLVF